MLYINNACQKGLLAIREGFQQVDVRVYTHVNKSVSTRCRKPFNAQLSPVKGRGQRTLSQSFSLLLDLMVLSTGSSDARLRTLGIPCDVS